MKTKKHLFLDIIFGTISIVSLGVAFSKSTENKVLREENTKLQRDLTKSYYHLGKLMTTKISRKA